MNELKESLQYLRDIINNIDEQHRSINRFGETSKRYTSKSKQCVYNLLNLNISASKVGDVLKTVLQLANIEPNKVPSKISFRYEFAHTLSITETLGRGIY